MPILALLLAAAPIAGAQPPAPDCRAAQLRLSVDGRDGDFDGMSHSGTQLAIRNVGSDCTIAALPLVQLRDARGRVLSVRRRPPVGMHPGPVMIPVRIAAGHRATIDLRWVSGPVYTNNRAVRAASVAVTVGGGTIRAPLTATLYADGAAAATFDQTPVKPAEGMAAG